MRTIAISILTAASAALATSVAAAQPAPHAGHHATEGPSTMIKTPHSIAAEHRQLHTTLEQASREPGSVGVAARELEAALSPHFRREEEIATPPLGLLPLLASGEVTPEMIAVLPLTQALERELPQMLKEHDVIRTALFKFQSAVQAAGQTDYVRFSESLAAHARQEEEILYPAAILVGRYIARAK